MVQPGNQLSREAAPDADFPSEFTPANESFESLGMWSAAVKIAHFPQPRRILTKRKK